MGHLLKPFNQMTAEDYAQLGFKAGLEIHQQLLTEKKLFCRCPAGIYKDSYDAEILRHMRPTLSELGEYDGTALMEFKTKKEIIYQINHETVCTYEMDDTPPFEINQQALDIALEIAMLLNYKMVSEIHIARKQYLDGSIPTGFQRTTIAGIDGWIPFKDRKINLFQLGLEEDACREVEDIGHQRIYRTDRLGMPLIEIVTRPEMKTPQEVAEVGNALRWLVRSTGKVRTGIGAARQDVNVSIEGGTRIEIKGVPRIPLIPRLIYNEVLRQYSLLKIREELHRRNITSDTFEANSSDVTHLLQKTIWEPIAQALQRNEKIYCVNLHGYNGILSHPTQTGRVFSREISDRVRVIACLTKLPNILTSESTEETIDSFAGNRIRKAVNATSQDALILVWGKQNDVETAVKEIIIRAREATIGVPSETRQALPDGTNGFERILPGPDRMYPDTDLPPLEIIDDRLENLAKNLPEPLWDRIKKYRKWEIPEHLLITISSSPQAVLLEEIIQKYKLPPKNIAVIIFEILKMIHKKYDISNQNEPELLQEFFSCASKQPALLEAARDIFTKFAQNGETGIRQLLRNYCPAKVNLKNLESRISDFILTIPVRDKQYQKYHEFLMGKLMSVYRGKIAGREVAEILKKAIAAERKKS